MGHLGCDTMGALKNKIERLRLDEVEVGPALDLLRGHNPSKLQLVATK